MGCWCHVSQTMLQSEFLTKKSNIGAMNHIVLCNTVYMFKKKKKLKYVHPYLRKLKELCLTNKPSFEDILSTILYATVN